MRIEIWRAIGWVPLIMVLGCAQPAAKMSWDTAYGLKEGSSDELQKEATRYRPPKETPELWAQKFNRAVDCEKAAVQLAERLKRDTGWTFLKGCIGRADFGHLELLFSHWLTELRARPEAIELLAQIIANRGGLVDQDVLSLQKYKLAVFTLKAAAGQPKIFAGRSVLFMGRVENIGTVKGRTELTVIEVAPQEAETRNFNTGYMRRSTVHMVETEVEVTVGLPQPDPFLTPGQIFLFLARFEGLSRVDQNSDDDAPQKRPSLRLVSYNPVGSQGAVED